MIGGPKLGKTSLVRTALQGLSDRTVIEVDCGTNPSPPLTGVSGSIVVLENLDVIDGPAIAPLLMRLSAAGTAGLVVTGGRRLRTLLGHSVTETGLSFRLFPLSVLLDGETCRLIGRDTNPSLAAWTGNHPYVTKKLLHYLHHSEDSDHAVAAGRCRSGSHRAASGCGHRRRPRAAAAVLPHRARETVNPVEAQSISGIEDIKAVADTLVYLGVISGWIRNEEATLLAGSDCRIITSPRSTILTGE